MQHHVSFKYAWEGIKYSFSTQPNFKIHFFFATLVLILGAFLKLPIVEWLVVLLTISFVLAAEMINTALESMTDLIEKKQNQQAKIAKDVSAGMVLLSAISSVVVGLFIFIPKIYQLLANNY